MDSVLRFTNMQTNAQNNTSTIWHNTSNHKYVIFCEVYYIGTVEKNEKNKGYIIDKFRETFVYTK